MSRQPIPSYHGTAEDYVQEGDALPETVKYNLQPYGTVTLGNLRLEPNANLLQVNNLVGEVIDGTETAYLFGHTKTSKVPAGEVRRIYGLRKSDLSADVVVRVAM